MTWKEVPNLFSNGKFKAIDNRIKKPLTITGFLTLSKGTEMFVTVDDWVEVVNCTLIARKIEDMSDDERKEVDWDDNLFWHYIEHAYSLSIDEFLYLLSIGVYPFDQSHFDTGEVIDIKTIGE